MRFLHGDRVRLRRKLISGLFSAIWGTLIFGVAINTLANLFTMPTDMPLSKLFIISFVMTHPIPVALCLGLLLLLTFFCFLWMGDRQSEAEASFDQQRRVRMLGRLNRSYHDLMDQSLQGTAWLELGLTSKPDAVRNPTNLLLHISNRAAQSLPSGTSITQAYDLVGHELLILGEPGAGKSTLLLDLAQQLLVQAEQDQTHPLPVILPLSSWAVRRLPLQDWIVEQMSEIYDVSHTLSKHWVQGGSILPLLDGLDEMEETARPACIAAINAYRRDYLSSLVICSRTAEYETAAEECRLALQGAVVVQPLTPKHVDAYLVQAGEPLRALRNALGKNIALRDLATTPLMLHILILTYKERSARGLANEGALLLRQVWGDYVQQMAERKGIHDRYPLTETRLRLSWLARQMRKRNQTVFYIEHMQPDWLPATQARKYEWLAVRLPGILMGVLLSLLVNALISNSFDPVRLIVYGFIGGHIGNLFSSAQIGMQVGRQMKLTRSIALSLRTSILIGLGIWLCILLTVGYTYTLGDMLHNGGITGLSSAVSSFLLCICCMFFYRSHERSISSSSITGFMHADGASWRRWIGNGILIGSCVGLTFGIVTWFFFLEDGADYAAIFGIRDGMTYGLTFALIGALLSIIFGRINREIHPTEILNWSLASLWRGLWSRRHLTLTCFVGLSLAVVFGAASSLNTFSGEWLSQHNLVAEIKPSLILSIGLGDGLTYGLTFGIAYWLLLGLYRGLSSDYLSPDDRSEPNEGIRRSLDNGMRIGLYGGLIIGLIGILSTTLYFGLHAGFGQGFTVGLIQGWYTGLNNALNAFSSGLIVGLQLVLFGGSLACVLIGGLACFRHFVLRRLLWQSGKIPFNYSDFLDRAAKCILLRKAGGGYMFVHLEFQDYMASLVECSSCGHVDDRRNRRFCSFCGKQ